MREGDTSQEVMPLRTNPVALPICRCVIAGTNGRDKCGATVSDPDSPLCDGCHQNHFGQPGYEVMGIPTR